MPSEASEEGALNCRRNSDAAVELLQSFRLGMPSNGRSFPHRSVRFPMYSSVELSCSRPIRRPKACLEAFTALPATTSMCSAVSLRLQEKKQKKQKTK